jgi:hypothetical protein
MTDIAATLNAAADTIERGWCQGTYARDAAGNRIRHDAPEAVSFCVRGAVHRQFELMSDPDKVAAFGFLHASSGIEDLVPWNDDPSRTKAEVVGLLRNAAEMAA